MAKFVQKQMELESKYSKERSKMFFWVFIGFIGFLLFLVSPAFGILVMVISGVAASSYEKNTKILDNGIKGEKEVQEVLKGLPSGYTILSDLTIKFNDKTSQIDNMIIGPNGIFIIETKNLSGAEISGDREDKEWTLHKIGRRGGEYDKTFYNPIKQVGGHVYTLSNFLKANNLNSWVQGVVYFADQFTPVYCGNVEGKTPVFSRQSGGERKILEYITYYEGRSTISSEKREKIIKLIMDCQ